MHMGANGDQIINAMTKAMKPRIRHVTNQVYLESTSVVMKQILSLWYKLMRTMKSTEFQKDDDCLRFDENTKDLNKAINSLITTPPVPGCQLKHSKQLKSHLLFDWEISTFLWTWRTLGGVDEQNIEGVHPQFNQLVRRFGNTHGGYRQHVVMDEFLFSCSTWIVETEDKMLSETKRNTMRGKDSGQ